MIDQDYQKKKAYENLTDQSYTQRNSNIIHAGKEDTEKTEGIDFIKDQVDKTKAKTRSEYRSNHTQKQNIKDENEKII